MKVKDLIEKLQEFDLEGYVFVRDAEYPDKWLALVSAIEYEIEEGCTEVFLE